MFDRFTTPEELFSFKLGSTLTAERDGIAVLEELSEAAQHDDLKRLLHAHADETRQQADTVAQAFRLLGEEEQTAPAPTAKGLAKEAQATLRKTDKGIADAAVIAAALENEHWEVAVYEVLVANAKARGADDVARVLQENLDQELRMASALHDALVRYSREGYPTTGAEPGAERFGGAEAAARAGA